MIADDDADIREVVRLLLGGAGYEVVEAVDGPSAIAAAQEEFDLIILDVMMPGCSGIAACEQIRRQTRAPILFLTAKSSEADKVLGFSAGGDDYLVKPFGYSELSARVRAMVRRYREYAPEGAAKPSRSETINMGSLVVYTESGKVELGGEELPLTDIEFRILLLLSSNPKKIFSTQNIYESIWDEPYFYTSSNTVMVHIRNLRRKLTADGEYPDVIKTAWGRGYHIG